MPRTLAEAELRRLARLGAIARLKEIEEEAAAIRSAFPGLAGATRPTKERAPEKRARRRRQMSPEAREAARKRMREYWAQKKSQAADTALVTTVADPSNGEAASGQPRKRRAPKRPRAKRAR